MWLVTHLPTENMQPDFLSVVFRPYSKRLVQWNWFANFTPIFKFFPNDVEYLKALKSIRTYAKWALTYLSVRRLNEVLLLEGEMDK